MQHSVKPSAVWIIVGVLIMFYLINHWMSREISPTTPPKQTVEVPLSDVVPEIQEPALLTIPGVPIDDKIVEPPIKALPKAVKQETQGPSEPIYEPPGNSVILVQ